MSEDYNSPQSPYWCLKTLISISLAKDSEFWEAEEEPYPSALFQPQLVPAPRQILSNHPAGNHHFCLSPAQFVAWPMKATQAKYSKFEYSSSFAFSVPTGPLIQQIAPDCTLALSRDGAETWAVKWKCLEPEFPTVHLKTRTGLQSISVASVRWFPWGNKQVEVKTTLIPPTDRWPDWHVRIHRIRINSPLRTLHTVEGGFASPGRRYRDGSKLPVLDTVDDTVNIGAEGVFEDTTSVLLLSSAGATGLSSGLTDGSLLKDSSIKARALKPDANTNIACQRTLIPTIERDLINDLQVGDEIVFVTRVFAMSASANSNRRVGSLADRWADQPIIDTKDGTGHGDKCDSIILDP